MLSSAWLVYDCVSAKSPSKSVFIALGILNAAATYAAKAHIHGFWSGKAKIPFVTNFNEAISTTNLVKVLLGYMSAGWIATGVLGLALGG